MPKDWKEFMKKMLDSYDGVHNKRYWSEITKYIESKASGTILDIGCGPGLLLNDLYKRFNPDHIYGIDLSDVMLEKANEILSKPIQANKVTLIKQHMQEDPTLPDNLDLIVSSRVIRSFENIKDVFESMHTSLNNGGRIVILDWCKRSIPTYEAWFANKNNEFENLAPHEVISYHRNFSRYDLEDWNYILRAFNFDVLHSFQVNPVICCVIGQKLLL